MGDKICIASRMLCFSVSPGSSAFKAGACTSGAFSEDLDFLHMPAPTGVASSIKHCVSQSVWSAEELLSTVAPLLEAFFTRCDVLQAMLRCLHPSLSFTEMSLQLNLFSTR